MKLIVDRVEHRNVVCEADDRTTMDLPLHVFEVPPKEGDMISYEGGIAKVLKQETEERQGKMQGLFERLIKK